MYGRVGVNARVLVSTGRTDTPTGAPTAASSPPAKPAAAFIPLVLGSTFENPGT